MSTPPTPLPSGPDTPGSTFSSTSTINAMAGCPPDPCAASSCIDDGLVSAVADRTKRLTGEEMVTTGKLPGDFGPQLVAADTPKCKLAAYRMGETVRQFNRYREALPYARAANDANQVGDKPGSESKGAPCLERLPDDADELNKALGLKPGTITDEVLRNDKTGFRAAMYRDQATGKLILVARDTQPHSLVDWKTNTDNGAGLDSDQYRSMRVLAGRLAKNGVPFDLAGYSKGGGLAQEGGLSAPNANVFVFNSAGLHDASLARTGQSSFENLVNRTRSFSAEGDFLTYMNNTTDPAQQIANAQYLRDRLGGGMFSPIAVNYRNPETLAAQAERDAAMRAVSWISAGHGIPPADLLERATQPVDETFQAAREAYLKGLDKMIQDGQAVIDAGGQLRLFPPVRSKLHETVPDSMTWLGKKFGAKEDEANLGRLVQHKMDNVLDPMEELVKSDREKLQKFLRECG